MRGFESLNPKIIQAWRGDGREVPKLAGLSLRGRTATLSEPKVLDMVVKSGQVEVPVDRRWFAGKKRFCLWMTNLPRAAWSAERVMSLYRCLRWRIGLLFKGGNHNRLQGFVTGESRLPRGWCGRSYCCRCE